MGVSRKQRAFLEHFRDEARDTKMKEKKIRKKLKESFGPLNNKRCYDSFKDIKSKSYHNLLTFLTYLDKALEAYYGKRKKYKKREVDQFLREVFDDLQERGCKTMREIDKVVKKSKDDEVLGFRFSGLLEGKIFYSGNHTSDETYIDAERANEDFIFRHGGYDLD